MNLILDIGNSRTKMCLFNNGNIIKQSTESTTNIHSLLSFCEINTIKNSIISTVSDGAIELYNFLTKQCSKCILLDESTTIPIYNLYETPQTLGRDRIAAAVGAEFLFSNKNILIIDSGTAITIDFITLRKQFIGGNISPGLNTRFKSLHNYTNKLPLLESQEAWPIIGNNTNDAIVAGVQQGIIFEIDGYIDYLKKQYGEILVVLTGGDAELLAKKINTRVIVEPFLVLKGLNRILDYNATKK